MRGNIEYIIVQAGGKGTRLGHLTRNKPKALVPVDNLPMLFHLFQRFQNQKFVIIGDYLIDVLDKYLDAFADNEYQLVNANGKKGTCGGLQDALSFIPENKKFLLIWCDLVLPDDFSVENLDSGNYIGISGSFPCRWKYENGIFEEERSIENGVAGLFVFQDKQELVDVPEEGEFVRWLSTKKIVFSRIDLSKTNEYGVLDEYEKLPTIKYRPFNRIEVNGDRLIKEGITDQGKQLAKREIAWYQNIKSHHFENLPVIYEYSPLTMEYITGKNIYEYEDFDIDQKKTILKQIIGCLHQLHQIGSCKADSISYEDAYITKTLDRLETVKKLVPFAKDEYVIVNGRKCRNFFFYIDETLEVMKRFMPERFVFLHGDCTFSNIMIRENGTPVLIDPRGYFGRTELFGDVAYDWAKLYYSIVGNYDQFNLKRFRLEIRDNDIKLEIRSSGWENLENDFFELVGSEVDKSQIKLIHAIIWLSLTTYAWQDYDSICGAFYNGLYYFEEAMNDETGI